MRGWIHLTIALAVLPWFAPPRSSACSKVPTRAWAGYPADGAVNVPLDAVPIYWTPGQGTSQLPFEAANLPPSLTVMWATASLQSEQGEQVALRPAQDGQASRFFEIAPRQLLAPNTRYIVTIKFERTGLPLGSLEDEVSIRFTTGHGLDDSDATAPSVAIDHYRATHVSSCEPGQAATCIGLPADQFFVWNVRGESRGGVARGSFFIAQPSVVPPFDCLEVQRRAPNGRLSQAATVCNAEGASYDVDALQGDPPSWIAIGCDERGLLLRDQPAAQFSPPEEQEPDLDAEAAAAEADVKDESEETEDDAEDTPEGAPSGSRRGTASCTAAPGAPISAAWPVAGLALVFACRRRRQG